MCRSSRTTSQRASVRRVIASSPLAAVTTDMPWRWKRAASGWRRSTSSSTISSRKGGLAVGIESTCSKAQRVVTQGACWNSLTTQASECKGAACGGGSTFFPPAPPLPTAGLLLYGLVLYHYTFVRAGLRAGGRGGETRQGR